MELCRSGVLFISLGVCKLGWYFKWVVDGEKVVRVCSEWGFFLLWRIEKDFG